MSKLASIGEAAQVLGVSASTLRRWEAEGKAVPTRTAAGHRRYDLTQLRPELIHAQENDRRTVAYARVSSHDQKNDLERQKQVLELYCARQGWTFEVVADLGSGMNYHKKGLKRLLTDVLDGRVGRLVLTHKDRLLRFGAELVFAICEAKNVEVVILNHGLPLKWTGRNPRTVGLLVLDTDGSEKTIGRRGGRLGPLEQDPIDRGRRQGVKQHG